VPPVPTPTDPVLVAPAEVSPGLTVVPLEDAEPAVDELGVDGLLAVDAGADAVVLGLAVLVGVAVWLVQGAVPVALAFFVLALELDVAEAVALLVALLVALPVAVTVLVAGELSLGLALSLAALPLEPVLAGLVTGVVGGTVGVTDFRDWFDGDGEALGGQAVAVVPARAAEVPA
jgi:hypothetical protein